MRITFDVRGCGSGERSTTGRGGLKAGHDGGACDVIAKDSALPGLDALFFGFGMLME